MVTGLDQCNVMCTVSHPSVSPKYSKGILVTPLSQWIPKSMGAQMPFMYCIFTKNLDTENPHTEPVHRDSIHRTCVYPHVYFT